MRDRLARLFPAPLAPSADAMSDDDGLPERGIDTRAASVVAFVAVLSIVLATFLLWRARPHSDDVGPAPAAAVLATASPVGEMRSFTDAAFAPDPTPTATPSVEPDLVVDVQGQVRRPGVVTLPAGSRVRDAIEASGGARTGTSTRSLNLAAPVSDGEQVVLGAPCASSAPMTASPMQASSAAPTVSGRPARAAAPVLIDLNRATTAELETLPGVGPVLAQRIVDYRTTHGRFTSVDELREVSGIGPAKFAEIRSRVRV